MRPFRFLPLVVGLSVALVTVAILTLVVPHRDFLAGLSAFFWAVTGLWALALFVFALTGWAVRDDDQPWTWVPRFLHPETWAEALSWMRFPSLDFTEGAGSFFWGLLVTLLAAVAAVALLVLLAGLVELVIFGVALALFALVGVFRAQVVRSHRVHRQLGPALGYAVVHAFFTVGWVPLLLGLVRLVVR